MIQQEKLDYSPNKEGTPSIIVDEQALAQLEQEHTLAQLEQFNPRNYEEYMMKNSVLDTDVENAVFGRGSFH